MPPKITTTKSLNGNRTTAVTLGVESDEYFQRDYFQSDYFQCPTLYVSANTVTTVVSTNRERTAIQL